MSNVFEDENSDLEANESTYEVDYIAGMVVLKDIEKKYLVKWSNYKITQNTWEVEENVRTLSDDYHNRMMRSILDYRSYLNKLEDGKYGNTIESKTEPLNIEGFRQSSLGSLEESSEIQYGQSDIPSLLNMREESKSKTLSPTKYQKDEFGDSIKPPTLSKLPSFNTFNRSLESSPDRAHSKQRDPIPDDLITNYGYKKHYQYRIRTRRNFRLKNGKSLNIPKDPADLFSVLDPLSPSINEKDFN
eukprot:NODE_105_length_19280_cov_0.929461.p9 type:complete len:245 gc:universal NODE_105_length_19280_cov_0.929461:12719-11985(-)